jgi:signal transduction histidine kinase
MYRRLSSYLKKLSSGVRIKPPKFILKEYSEISQAVYELQSESLSKKYIEVHSDQIVHDIKNLNIGISKGVNDLVEIYKEVNSEFLDIKEELIESSNRMKLLMMQLIEISKLEKTVLKISKFSIDNVLEKILNDIKIIHALKNKNIQVNININSNIYIEAEKDLIETCLKSAINNAIDFTPKRLDLNNIKEITFEAVESQDDFIIRIHDQGVGIPEEIIDKVNSSDTEYISMPRPDTGYRSTGLGFKISLKIMSLHGGSVVIRNRRDTQGVVVTFTIPKKANNY